MARTAGKCTVAQVDTSSADRLPLALRYRPRSLAELTGQRHVAAVLGAALRDGQIPQQLLFSGDSGIGKTTTARIAAAALMCETPLAERTNGDACGRCESCRDITTPGHVHPDVIELDAASHGGKDEIRDIAASAALAPLRGPKKVYIIDEAHGLSGPGGQAFLKLLEEPPPHVVFMLCTTDPQKLAKANRGRCTEFELLRPSDAELVANLQRVAKGEGWPLSAETAAAVVEATDPALGVRGTLMTLEKLSSLLAAGHDPSAEELAERLGVAAPAALSSLVGAISAGQRADAVHQLVQLRASVSDDRIRSGLLEWARRELQRSATGEGPSLEIATWRLAALAESPASEVFTDLAVSRLAAPALRPDCESLAAYTAEAERLLAELAKRCAEAEARAEELRGLAQAAATPATAGRAPRGAPPHIRTGHGPAPGSRRQGTARSSATAPTHQAAGQPGATPAVDERLEVLLARLEESDRRVAAMLRSTKPSLEGDVVRIQAPPGLLARVRQERPAIEAVAARLHLHVELAPAP